MRYDMRHDMRHTMRHDMRHDIQNTIYSIMMYNVQNVRHIPHSIENLHIILTYSYELPTKLSQN